MNKPTEQAIEDYLDQLSAQLRALPPEIQQETRDELRQHLQSLVAMQRDPQRITESALRQFGDPAEIGKRLALEWEEGEWSLSGLPLLQRIDKIREAGAIELTLHQSNFQLKALNWFQASLPFLNIFLSPHALGTVSGSQVPSALFTITHFGVLGLYLVVGLMACCVEWRDVTRPGAGTAQNRRRALRNIIARAGMSILLPCMFLFPNQGALVGGAMLMLCIVLLGLIPYQSPRVRLALQGSLGYGVVMGLVVGAVNLWLISHVSFGSWLSLMLLPVYYAIGRWFYKRPKKS